MCIRDREEIVKVLEAVQGALLPVQDTQAGHNIQANCQYLPTYLPSKYSKICNSDPTSLRHNVDSLNHSSDTTTTLNIWLKHVLESVNIIVLFFKILTDKSLKFIYKKHNLL